MRYQMAFFSEELNMAPHRTILFCGQLVLIVVTLTLSFWLGVPLFVLLAMGLTAIPALVLAVLVPEIGRACSKVFLVTGWGASALCWWFLLMGGHAPDALYGVLGWLMAALLILSASVCPSGGRLRTAIRALGVSWGLCGTACWLVYAYAQNRGPEFYLGLFVAAGLLVLCKRWFASSLSFIVAANTLLLVLVGFPIADFLYAPGDHLNTVPLLSARPYSFDAARHDRAAHARWWKHYMAEGVKLYRQIFTRDPGGVLPFYLKPNAQAQFCESKIIINSLGFRGREITIEKGDAFRIVALGESTTWGATLSADDQPWPQKLEHLVRDHRHLSCPIEVVNAGVPSITLAENIVRLERSILALKPDIIVSYHGYNGFPWLDAALPAIRTSKPPPRYRRRPLKLLADCEYRMQLLKFTSKERLTGANPKSNDAALDPLDSEYAQHYERLIEIARSNGIPLVVATYSMAINETSAREVAGFYQHFIPTLQRQVKANTMHTGVLEALARRHPGVILVDTQPRLDGHYEYFIDLMHFTEEGRDIIAELFFEAIKPVLETHSRLNSASAVRK